MTGLDLEHYLRLLRTEPAIWINAAVGTAFVTAIIWASYGRRKMLQRCLIISMGLHIAIAVYGGPQASRWMRAQTLASLPDQASHMRSVQLVNRAESDNANDPRKDPDSPRKEPSAWDHPEELKINEAPLSALPPTPRDTVNPPKHDADAPDLTERVEVPDPSFSEARAEPRADREPDVELDLQKGAQRPISDNEKLAVEEVSEPDSARTLPAQPEVGAGEPANPPTTSAKPGLTPRRRPELALAEANDASLSPIVTDVANRAASNRETAERVVGDESPLALDASERASSNKDAVTVGDSEPTPGSGVGDLSFPEPDETLASRGSRTRPGGRLAGSIRTSRSTPDVGLSPTPNLGVAPGDMPSMARNPGSRPAADVPDVYRSRLAPNRSALALGAGATRASEEAVERALVWLSKHQDADGRWNAGADRVNGAVASVGSSFTVHCPPNDRCVGDCFYSEADTAITGLALLAFLGAGHTHQSGPYAGNVERGIEFLLASQKPDGDLRGKALSVGMYCHAIATLALSEDYALTHDERLRPAVERAVTFLVASRTVERQSWRYEPNDPMPGDTSILGWAVMVLKSAKEMRIAIPADVRPGVVTWLERVSGGKEGGLAMYRPPGMRDGGPITPSMTAEAWVCRQFLGIGGPGPASNEAAAYLLEHGPDRDPFNLYYWYYATIALFQHGGDAWTQWNTRVRDNLVMRQVRSGHADGSWDPRENRDKYNATGGRIYTTALATLTLEVYYRYLPMYNAPGTVRRDTTSDPEVKQTTGSDTGDHSNETPVPDAVAPEIPNR